MKKILLIIAISSSFGAFAGGPWTQPKGKGYFKLSEWWLVFDQHYTDKGLIDPNVTTGIFNTNIYAEYGFTNRFTGVLYLPFFSRNYMNNLRSQTTGEVVVKGEAINSLGDADLGFKYSLTKPGSAFPVAFSITFGLPLGTPVAGELDNLQTGDGEFNKLMKLDFGKGYKAFGKGSYFSGFVGFNNRTNGFSDEFRFGVETGFELQKDKFWVVLRSFGVESFKNGTTAEDNVTSTSIFANNTEYISAEMEIAYYISKKFGFSASVGGAFRGEIIAARPSYSVGVFFDMNK